MAIERIDASDEPVPFKVIRGMIDFKEEGAEEVQEVTPEIARETNRLITSISSFSAQLNNLAGAAERGIGVLTQRFKGMRDSAKRLEEGLHEQVLNSTDLQTNRN